MRGIAFDICSYVIMWFSEKTVISVIVITVIVSLLPLGSCNDIFAVVAKLRS